MNELIQTCSKCLLNSEESLEEFSDRISNGKYITSFKCKKCRETDFEFQKTQEIKELIRNTRNNEIFQVQLKEQNEERKKRYRIMGALIRAKRLLAYEKVSDKENNNIKKFYNECPAGWHVDHIIPLTKGGKHCISNMRYLPAQVNIEKSDKIIDLHILEYGEKPSLCLLQRKFKLTYEAAQKIYKELTT